MEKELIGEAENFILVFKDNVPLIVRVKVPLGTAYAGKYATICIQRSKKERETAQTVLIDKDGNAFFYLDKVNKKTGYLVASGNKYVVTGTKINIRNKNGQMATCHLP